MKLASRKFGVALGAIRNEKPAQLLLSSKEYAMEQEAAEMALGETVTVKELKSHLGDLLRHVQFGGAQLVVTSKPAAALIAIETLALLRRLKDLDDVEAAREARAEARAIGTISLADGENVARL